MLLLQNQIKGGVSMLATENTAAIAQSKKLWVM
jgi:hypothetical protein